jgi:hypothetical protein
MLTFPSSNFLLQAQHPPVQRLSFADENRHVRGAFCLTEINRWIARWENEGGVWPHSTGASSRKKMYAEKSSPKSITSDAKKEPDANLGVPETGVEAR